MRASTLLILACAGVVPFIHMVVLFGPVHVYVSLSSQWLIAMMLFYLIGVVIYVFQIPERFSPGKFDIYVKL